MLSSSEKKIKKILDAILPTSHSVDGQDLADLEELDGASITGAELGSLKLSGLEWTECIVATSRFSATVFENSTFDHVVFRDCELSGVSFIDCIFRNCLILGGKSTSLLSFVDSSLSLLFIAGMRIDRLEIQGSRIGTLSLTESRVGALNFHHCVPHSKKAHVTLATLDMESVGGVSKLPDAGVTVSIDRSLWEQLGDLYLKQLGLTPMSETDEADTSEILTKSTELMTNPKP